MMLQSISSDYSSSFCCPKKRHLRVYTSVCGRFSVWKKCVRPLSLCVCVCVCVSFAVATVNGKRQPSLATKSVSHALALQPLPWQPRLCTRLFFFFCHCAFTRNGCWRRRDYNRGLHFLSLFINPGSLVPTVDVVLGIVQGLAQPLPPKS